MCVHVCTCVYACMRVSLSCVIFRSLFFFPPTDPRPLTSAFSRLHLSEEPSLGVASATSVLSHSTRAQGPQATRSGELIHMTRAIKTVAQLILRSDNSSFDKRNVTQPITSVFNSDEPLQFFDIRCMVMIEDMQKKLVVSYPVSFISKAFI